MLALSLEYASLLSMPAPEFAVITSNPTPQKPGLKKKETQQFVGRISLSAESSLSSFLVVNPPRKNGAQTERNSISCHYKRSDKHASFACRSIVSQMPNLIT